MTKTYSINLNEAVLYFYLGKTKIKVSFSGGCSFGETRTPATYTTNNEIIQRAIEIDSRFGQSISLLRITDDKGRNVNVADYLKKQKEEEERMIRKAEEEARNKAEEEAKKASEAEKADEGESPKDEDENPKGEQKQEEDLKQEKSQTVYDEVTDINGAIDVLKSLGVPHQALRSSESIKNKAIEMNVSFPNLKL